MFVLNPIKVTVKGNEYSLRRLVRDRVEYCTKPKCVLGQGLGEKFQWRGSGRARLRPVRDVRPTGKAGPQQVDEVVGCADSVGVQSQRATPAQNEKQRVLRLGKL